MFDIYAAKMQHYVYRSGLQPSDSNLRLLEQSENIGPIFFKSKITADAYVVILRQSFFTQIQIRSINIDWYWFSKTLPLPHKTGNVFDIINSKFWTRVIVYQSNALSIFFTRYETIWFRSLWSYERFNLQEEADIPYYLQNFHKCLNFTLNDSKCVSVKICMLIKIHSVYVCISIYLSPSLSVYICIGKHVIFMYSDAGKDSCSFQTAKYKELQKWMSFTRLIWSNVPFILLSSHPVKTCML